MLPLKHKVLLCRYPLKKCIPIGILLKIQYLSVNKTAETETNSTLDSQINNTKQIPKINECTALYIWKSKEWKKCTCPKIVFIFGIIKAMSYSF